MEFHEIAYDFLKTAKVTVSKNYLRERLESHSHYPSLNSFTDLLDELGVENSAMRIEQKQRWKELDFPILVHKLSKNGIQDFQVIKKTTGVVSEKDFLASWTGIVLLLGNNKKIAHDEHDKQKFKERLQVKTTYVVFGMLVFLLFINQVYSFDPALFVHFSLAFAGLITSGVIIAYDLGVKTNVSEMFCSTESSGCSAVLNSRLGKFGSGIGLADIAAVFFGGLVFYLSFSGGFNIEVNMLFLVIIQSLAFLFTFLSLGYQWRLKSWCKLCLLTTLIIWLQTINLSFFLYNSPSFFSFDSFVLVRPSILFAICLGIAANWMVLKPILISSKRGLSQKIRIRKWRQDPHWFDALLPLHKQVDDRIWNREIYYGNPSGVLQFLIISSPFCEYCAKAHQELEQILEEHPEDIGVRIRFLAQSSNAQSDDYDMVFKILNAYEELVWSKNLNYQSNKMKQIVDDWYTDQNHDAWLKKYDLKVTHDDVVEEIMTKTREWKDDMKISNVPAFFINGHEMPNPHTFKDLFLFVSDYIEILKSKTIESRFKLSDHAKS